MPLSLDQESVHPALPGKVRSREIWDFSRHTERPHAFRECGDREPSGTGAESKGWGGLVFARTHFGSFGVSGASPAFPRVWPLESCLYG